MYEEDDVRHDSSLAIIHHVDFNESTPNTCSRYHQNSLKTSQSSLVVLTLKLIYSLHSVQVLRRLDKYIHGSRQQRAS